MGVLGERLEITHRIAADPGAEDGFTNQRRQGGKATGTASLHRHPLGIHQPLLHQMGDRCRAVSHIENAPLTIEPLAVGAAETGGTAVIDIHHPPTAAGPELNRQVQPGASHAGGSAMGLHQQRSRAWICACGGVVPAMAGLSIAAGKLQSPGLTDAHQLLGQGGRWLQRAMAGCCQIQLQQGGALCGRGAQANRALR